MQLETETVPTSVPAQEEVSDRIFTVANFITFLRLCLIPISFALLLQGRDIAAGVLIAREAGAITGGIAWVYYAVQSGRYSGWLHDRIDPAMLEIKRQAKTYLPEGFIRIADELQKVCAQRAGTFDRSGFCTPILSPADDERFWYNWDEAKEAQGGRTR